MARKAKKTEKQEQRERLKSLYPDAVEYMRLALKGELKNVDGKKQHATVGQKLDIAKIVVDQVVGRPAQSTPIGGDSERPPVNTLEVIKTYETLPGAASPLSGDMVPFDEPPAGAANREEWLQALEDEALAGPKEPDKTPRQLREAAAHEVYLADGAVGE